MLSKFVVDGKIGDFLKGAVSQSGTRSSTAGVNFQSRYSTATIYKNASTGPVLSFRSRFLMVGQKKSESKKMVQMVFEAISWSSVPPKVIKFELKIVVGFTALLERFVGAL